MKTIRLIAALFLFLAAAATTTPTPAAAQDETTSSTNDSNDARLALIIDSSESMQEQDGDGTRLDTAKQVTKDTLADLPDGIDTTLFAYGSQVKAASDNRDEGCRDVTTISRNDIDSLEALGYTPIGASLLEASDALGSDGNRAIVLISDGMDTCAPPDVCDVAKDLAKDNIGLAVNIIGFKVDDAAREQLSCITDATGGAYLDAADRDELSTAPARKAPLTPWPPTPTTPNTWAKANTSPRPISPTTPTWKASPSSTSDWASPTATSPTSAPLPYRTTGPGTAKPATTSTSDWNLKTLPTLNAPITRWASATLPVWRHATSVSPSTPPRSASDHATTTATWTNG